MPPKEDKQITGKSASPLRYKVICISIYTDDLQRLDDMVGALKARGLARANRSALIRHALSNVALEQVTPALFETRE